MENKIKNKFKEFGIDLDEIQIKQFKEYYSFLIQENGKFNLTAITSFDEVLEKHFLDSVIPYKTFKFGSSIVDIGTGAGFPGIPLKILRPDLKITLVDSLNKRINFLKELISMLNLKNISAIHARAEDFAIKNREKFDFAVSRAVARASTLSEYLLPFVKIGGYAVFYKSQSVDEEIKEAEKAIQILGGRVYKKDDFIINGNKRSIILVKKENKTPLTYPRGKNLPKTKPII